MDQITPLLPPLLPQALAPTKRTDSGDSLRWNAAQAQVLVVLGLALTVFWLGAMAFGLALLVWNAV
jgi:cytochrome c biogenesis protein CcdA